jgi:hypothetical protein
MIEPAEEVVVAKQLRDEFDEENIRRQAAETAKRALKDELEDVRIHIDEDDFSKVARSRRIQRSCSGDFLDVRRSRTQYPFTRQSPNSHGDHKKGSENCLVFEKGLWRAG